jgi:S-DNA-T family DNA segregation ATPase FtsK/SpoIIIE
MKILGPTPLERLNEAVGLVCLAAAVALTLSLISYQPLDPSWNTASGAVRAHNLIGQSGAWIADLLLQTFGLASYLLPAFLTALAWKWIRSSPIDTQWAKICGAVLLGFSTSSMLSMGNDWGVRAASMSPGGVVGSVFASWLLGAFNLTGAVLVCSTWLLLSLYLISTFSLRGLPEWLMTPLRGFQQLRAAFREWRESMRRHSEQRAAARQQEMLRRDAARGDDDLSLRPRRRRGDLSDDMQPVEPRVSPLAPGSDSGRAGTTTDVRRRTELYTVVSTLDDEIPIRTLDGAGEDEHHLTAPARAGTVSTPPFEPTREPAVVEYVPPPPAAAPAAARAAVEPMTQRTSSRPLAHFVLPSTELLNAAEARTSFDTDELKTIAGRIKSKFEEFNVLGNITQINPGLHLTSATRSSAATKVLIPSLQKLVRVLTHELHNASQLFCLEAHAPRQFYRIEPELRRHIVSVHMHVRRLVRFVTVEVEAVRSAAQHRGHELSYFLVFVPQPGNSRSRFISPRQLTQPVHFFSSGRGGWNRRSNIGRCVDKSSIVFGSPRMLCICSICFRKA